MNVVMFSGGIGSWAAAKRVAETEPGEMILLFCDTLIEDEDTYRFLDDAAANIGAPLIRIAEGRTPWQVFHDERFLGNHRFDPCSRILKRELADRWLVEHCDMATTVVIVGIDWSEEHRFERLRERKLPWVYRAPMCEAPYLTKTQMHDWATREGLQQQRLYKMGAAHANCGGGCVKAGIGAFARLYRTMPERFAEWERNEAALRELLGDVAILTDRRGGKRRIMPLSEVRERVDAERKIDEFDIGGCGCFSGDDE